MRIPQHSVSPLSTELTGLSPRRLAILQSKFLQMVAEEILDPSLRKTQPSHKLIKEIFDESAELCRALDDQRRSFPFETLPDQLDLPC